MAPPAAPRALYIDGGHEPIFAVFHPASTPSAGNAVLLCPPFGWEDMCSYRSRRIWAQHLADGGHAALRIDFPGSGDSGGGPHDPGRLAAWTDAVAAAADWLAAETACDRITAVGIGVGGLVAYRAAAAAARVDDLVLWAVHARGRTHTRELRAFASMQGAGAERMGAEELPEGAVAVAGYMLAAETRAELDLVDLSDLVLPAADARRVLLLGRDGRAVDERLVEALKNAGADVATGPGKGYGRMVTLEPQDAVPAQSVFDEVDEWLAATDAPSPHRDPTPRIVREAADVALGGGVRERPFSFRDPFGDPFGVLAESELGPAPICVVWLNAGPQRRTGPNRMWTEAARRWAGRGVPSLRVDLAGIGDAEGDERPLVDARSFYVDRYVEQVRAVLDTLDASPSPALPRRYVLCGLCAGGYWALQASLDDPRVSAAILLNPGALVWDEGLSLAVGQTRTLAQKAMQWRTWKRVFSGQTTFSAHLRTARVLAGAAWRAIRAIPGRIQGLWVHAARDDELDSALRRMTQGGRSLSIVFAGEEPLYRRLATDGSLERIAQWPNVSVDHVELAENVHTLRPLWVQHRVHELIDAAIERELASCRADGAPAT